MQQVKGVIARAKDAPVELVTINVPDPGPGEAVVTIRHRGGSTDETLTVQGIVDATGIGRIDETGDPLLRRLKWQEVASLNYLTTPAAGHYLELGAGIEHVFKVMRVDFYTSLQSGRRAGTGIRVGIGF